MENKDLTNINDAAYQKLIDNITTLWGEAKSKAIAAVNTELLDANWQTGKYIVEFEQGGKQRAEYGKRLLVNLAKDLTARNGKGFNRTNLTYMRKLYLAFPKCGTLSHKLTWSHYYELLKCDNALEMQFYYKESIKECWKVRELKRQMKSCLFQRLALSTDKAGVLALANEGHQVQTPQDIIRDPFVLEFAGLPKQKRYKESDLEKALKDHMEQFLLEMLCKPLHKSSSMKRCKRLMSSCSRSVSRKCSPCGIPRNSRIYGSRMISLGSTRPGSVREISSFTAFLSRLASRRS